MEELSDLEGSRGMVDDAAIRGKTGMRDHDLDIRRQAAFYNNQHLD